ncbi:MAG TPA: DUF3048 domain-containing protein [Spirochaetia bacterium]|nr:DUF3048 domain-containing protein [Spirochaetia bacterium]
MSSLKVFSLKTVIGLIITFLVSGGIAYAVVPGNGGLLISPKTISEEPVKTTGFGQFANEPKTEACPINGKLYSKSEKALWETRRPILAMIENDVSVRPQSGLSLADVVYEAVAEGGITRFMGVFYCGAQADTARVAPVRSARIYFVNIAAEYNTPIYMHVGGANCGRDEGTGQCVSHPKSFAIEELAKLGWRKPGGNDFDTTGDTGMPVLFRDANRRGNDTPDITEHTMVGSLPAAWKQAEKRGYTSKMPNDMPWLSGFKTWKTDPDITVTGTPATSIKFDFWSNYKDFAVEWKYDTASKTYLRFTAGVAHMDFDTKQQLSAANVVVQFAKETQLGDYGKHLYYDIIGSGTGYIFQNGVVTEVTWKKPKQLERTIFTDKAGKEIVFTPGNIWVELLPTGNKVEYN